jgi:hypothetical protein
MQDQIALKIIEVEQLGDDCRLIAVPTRVSGADPSSARSDDR